MLEFAGSPVLMGNCIAELKELRVADYFVE